MVIGREREGNKNVILNKSWLVIDIVMKKSKKKCDVLVRLRSCFFCVFP